MRKYVMTKEEKEFLKSYDMSEFNRPSLTADIAVFAILQGEESNEYRKDPEQKLGPQSYEPPAGCPSGFRLRCNDRTEGDLWGPVSECGGQGNIQRHQLYASPKDS